VKPYNLSVTDVGELAMDLVDTATIILGAPAVLTGPHPLAAYATILVDALRPKAKHFGIIGSYGWKCQLVEKVVSLISRIKPEVFEPIVVRGKVTDKGLKALNNLAELIYEKHKALGIAK
jgi:flavorubredoxin